MGFIEDLTRRVRRLDIFDVKLAQLSAAFFVLIIAKLIPDIMDVSIWWFIALLILCSAKPFYVFWFKE
jgi:hypothetical protein